MRFLELQDDGCLGLTEDLASGFPPYAILSHTWGSNNQEVTYADIKAGTGQHKDGYRKIRFCGDLAARDGLKYFWVDTCCIDKTNSTELSEAINSMFRWYKHSAKCYVYLSDVVKYSPAQSNWKDSFRTSRWHTRGWTLQELVAPDSVEFFSADHQRLGDKKSLERLIHDITGIAISALRGVPLAEFSDIELMSWSANRQTKKEEDRAYCLLGIFRVHMPLIYGEGRESALRRLREVVDKRSGTRGDRYVVPSRTQDKSHFMVPLERNEDFVGREAILAKLLDLIPPSTNEDVCQRTIIEGLGGVGKTQIALEAAHRVGRAYPTCSVFWVPAVSATSFENAYREIGRLLGTKGTDEEMADVKSLVKAALSHESVTSWLLIIDNADDLKLLEEISSYFPFNRRGSILFTTRNHEVGIRLDIRQRNIMSLGELSDAEAAEILQNGLKESQIGGTESTIRLLQFLSNLPLAIKQASFYMAKTGMTTRQYLSHCESSDKTLIKLLSKDFEDRGRYKTLGSNPIATTWLITFEHIQRDYPVAARYLKFICFLAEKDIPVSLLPSEEDGLTRDEAIGTLKGYAIIMEREDSTSFDIHRLVRLAMRNWLESQEELADYVTATLQNLSSKFPHPGVTWEEKKVWTRLLPHVQTALELQDHCADEDTRADLLYRVGRCNYHLGKYAIAALLFQQALVIELRVKGPEHWSTLRIMDYLALALSPQGKYDEAWQIHRQVTEVRERNLGKEHPDTLASLHNLADVLESKRKYEKAEEIYRQVIEAEERVLGKGHPDTLVSLHSLADVLESKREYEKAEKIYRQVIEAKERVLGKEHPSILVSLHNLAYVLERKKEYKKAEEIYRQVIEVRERVLGKEHPHTLASLHNLAVVLESKKKYEKAEEIYRQIIEVKERVLGKEHPTTLLTKRCLAGLLAAKRDHSQQQEEMGGEDEGGTKRERRGERRRQRQGKRKRDSAKFSEEDGA
ncbi:hypothetical protein F5Y09DRAFT_343467 [Xylaria sp. FL1042]|nr:hypothetical protein F5Y09DRAFT_343467 [Xylaria sp. FL1042]